jgi:glyoxylase-like metal-dependent hydrolase (beta-lactamase superfamily II)
VLLIPAGNASAWTGPTGNNTFLLPGAVPTLIDAGVGAPGHVAAIAQALGGRPLALVLVTHGHPDHVAGVPALVERWPSLRIRGADDVADGARLAAGDTSLRAIHTPGHAPDHLCFFDGASGDLFCGDLARAGGTIVIPASRGGRLADYLRSLQRVRELAPRRLLPGHGPIVDDPAALLDEYIRHRQTREAQIVAALEAGCDAPEAIVARVYGALAPPLLAAAADSVLAHLIKLEEDGAAVNSNGRWTLRR